jgi:hypothetical protein
MSGRNFITVVTILIFTLSGESVQSTPLEDVNGTTVSALEFGSFKL